MPAEEVLKAVKAFPRGSAAGSSGLRPQHLQDALVPGGAHEAVRQLTALCVLLLKGRVCEGAQPWFCGAKLVALPKPVGSLRPVAVGETLRRLVGKAAFAAAKEESSHFSREWALREGRRRWCTPRGTGCDATGTPPAKCS